MTFVHSYPSVSGYSFLDSRLPDQMEMVGDQVVVFHQSCREWLELNYE